MSTERNGNHEHYLFVIFLNINRVDADGLAAATVLTFDLVGFSPDTVLLIFR